MTLQTDQLKRVPWKGRTTGTGTSYGSFSWFITEEEYFPGAWQDKKNEQLSDSWVVLQILCSAANPKLTINACQLCFFGCLLVSAPACCVPVLACPRGSCEDTALSRAEGQPFRAGACGTAHGLSPVHLQKKRGFT